MQHTVENQRWLPLSGSLFLWAWDPWTVAVISLKKQLKSIFLNLLLISFCCYVFIFFMFPVFHCEALCDFYRERCSINKMLLSRTYFTLITDTAFHFSPVTAAEGHGLFLSLMHHKFPITTCWLALRGPVACWWTTPHHYPEHQWTGNTHWLGYFNTTCPRPASEPCLQVHDLLQPAEFG